MSTKKQIEAEGNSSASSAVGTTSSVGDETKQCSTCLGKFQLSNFYSKGNRRDSRCKTCSRGKKRATYLQQKDKYNVDHVRRVFDILLEHKIEQMKQFNLKLKEVIEKCQQNEKQP